MKIVIAGAGEIGFHLAKLLSSEKQDITIIDIDSEALEAATKNLDVLTIRGDSSSLSVLKKAEAADADLFLSVTTSEENNLMSAIVAKKLGAKQTVARVSNPEYLEDEQVNFFRELGIDHTISPRELAFCEIKGMLDSSDITDVFEFENGKVVVMGLLIDERSEILNRTIKGVRDTYTDKTFEPIAILRGGTTIFPTEDTRISRKDHIFFITDKQEKEDIKAIVGNQTQQIKRIMILGGSNLGLRTAQLLENDYRVTIVEESKGRCTRMHETLMKSMIVKGDPSDMAMLKEEGFDNMDAVIALTDKTETNILASLMADVAGVYKTIALVDKADYVHISHNIGVDSLINKKLITANNIFQFVRKGQIEGICAMNGVDAEIIEFLISDKSRASKKQLKDIRFPKDAIIGAVIRDDKVFHPKGDFQLQAGDKAFVFAMNKVINKVEKFFR